MSKKKYIIEWIGDFYGAPTFQGGPYGYGNKTQLVNPKTEKSLKIPENSDESGLVNERSGTDMFYRDLPGYPEHNAIVHPKSFVPRDPNENASDDYLGPTVLGKPVDGVDTWKSTTPELRGKVIIKMNQLVNQQDFVPESFQGTPSMTPGEGRSAWSSATLENPKDFLKQLLLLRTGDITAKNPIGSMGVLRHPVSHVPKGDKQHPPEVLEEAVGIIPGLAELGRTIPPNILTNINQKGIEALNTKFPPQFEGKLKEIEQELAANNIPKPQIDNVINKITKAYQDKQEEIGKSIAGKFGRKPIVAPPSFVGVTAQQKKESELRNLNMPDPDQIGALQTYVRNYSASENQMEKQMIMKNIFADMKDIGEDKIRNFIYSSYERTPNSAIGKFYSELFQHIFRKPYEAPQVQQQQPATLASQEQQTQTMQQKLSALKSRR